ncbi:hypothetical protein AT15_06330 [Kosmotoga arenicorallina S304]|uniref:CRISPR-associated protein Cmr3 n=1 Tax=Kosmotoga arenicorallina S304 TaxID=1453497 RepID=A0A176JTP4_9BACT|nr:type III-B CRISPR module-associated protein Cmr3 [Kosmotoga arenicorallina]OAA26689.1 hypothetical protein AT15_06330 [Kosmotoga arenicorallina S304]
MKYNVVYFEPEEWVAFRENTGFEIGTSARLSQPKVETFLGAVRTAFLRKSGTDPENIPEEIASKIGNSFSSGLFKMVGPFIYSEDRHYLPAPANLYELTDEEESESKSNKKKEYKLMVPNKELSHNYDGFDLNLPWIPYSKKVAKQPEGELIEIKSLEALQKGKLDELNLARFADHIAAIETHDELNLARFADHIAAIETHVGIALEKNAKKTEEGMLYSINTYRFKENSGFYFFIDNKTKEIIKEIDEVFLGMKQRVAKLRFGEIETNLFEFKSNNKSAVCLITPAIFNNGFMPSDGMMKSTKITSAIVKRKIPISGWDLAKNEPKPIYHAVPPGSVYFLDGSIDNDLFTNSISDMLDDFGYGRYFTINWDFFRRGING